MRIAMSLLLLSAIGLIAADEPKKTSDAEKFKGKWSIVSMRMGGRSAPAELIKNLRTQFDEKTYNNTIGDQVVEEGGYIIEASKTPKTIDLDIKKGHDAGKKQLGIYKLENDKLTLVVSEAGSTTRPKSFKAEPEESLLEVVLERVKP